MFPVELISLPKLLAGLMFCLFCVHTHAQTSDTAALQGIPVPSTSGETSANKSISSFLARLNFLELNGGLVSYTLNTNSGFNYSNSLPPSSQQLRINYGLSLFRMPLLIGGQYGFGNETYSADYFFVTLDQTRLEELKRLRQSPLQKIKHTSDSMTSWNTHALDRLRSCEGELDKYKKLPDFGRIQEYEQLSRTFADSFEYLDSSRLKELFSKRQELADVRDKYNAYSQIKGQKQKLLDGYNANVDSLQKLKELEGLGAGLDKKFHEKELKKLNFGMVQPGEGIQTTYGRPLRGLNLAYQYGKWYGEVLAGTSINANLGIPAENPENLLQFIGGLKTEEEELLLHATRLTSRSKDKIFTFPLEQTSNLGLKAMKVLGHFRFEGDLSGSYYRNTALNEGFNYSELADSTLPVHTATTKPVYNYSLKTTYSQKAFRFSLGHDHQGSAWRFGALSFPTQNLSRYMAQMNISLFKGKLDHELGGSLTRVAKELGSAHRNYVFSAGLKWRINSFNTLQSRHQYVVSGTPVNPVEQNITSLAYSNVSRLFQRAMVSSITLLRHELMSRFIYQQNFNLVAQSAYRISNAMNMTLMVQKFMMVETKQRNQTSVQIGCQGAVKEFSYQLNLGTNHSQTSTSFTARAGLAWQSTKHRLGGAFTCTYNQLMSSAFLNANLGEITRLTAPYNLITNLSLSYRL